MSRAGAEARAALYARLAELLSFPDGSFERGLRSGEIRDELTGLVGSLPFRLTLDGGGLVSAGADPEAADVQAEYIRLFDLPGSAVCPLYGGRYDGDRRRVMEELVRFYRHFGLSTANAARDLPDSVLTVLEFMAFLALAEGAQGPKGRVALRAAQCDVLSRHLGRWTPEIASRLCAAGAAAPYAALGSLLDELVRADLAYLGGVPVPAGR